MTGAKTIRKVSAVLIALIVAIAMLGFTTEYAHAEIGPIHVVEGDFEFDLWTSDDGKTPSSLVVTKYNGTAKTVTLPSKVIYNGLVYDEDMSVGTDCFKGNATVEKVIIPGSFAALAEGAFSGCTTLEEIVIADSVNFAGTGAFSGCQNLKTYKIGSESIMGMRGSGIGQDSEGVIYSGVNAFVKGGSDVERSINFINNDSSGYTIHINPSDDPAAEANSAQLVIVIGSDHILTKVNAKAATCTANGNKAYWKCSHCTKFFSDAAGTKEIAKNSWVIKATGHSWNAGKVTKEPTTTATGVKTYTCKKCGKKKTATLAKLSIVEALSEGASEEAVDTAVTKWKKETDPKGTVYNLLQARLSKATKTSIKLTYKKVKGAKKYVIYGNRCGLTRKLTKLTTTGKTSMTFKKVLKKKVKKGTYYKFMVVAIDKKGKVITTSKIVHATTKGGKYGNDKKVTTKAKKNKVSLKKGKSFKLRAKEVAQSKKLKVKRHRKINYETTNKKIATVSSKGVIKGKKKGTCYVYAYAQNGVFSKIKVTVK